MVDCSHCKGYFDSRFRLSFGTCISELHKERVQNLIFGSSYRGISPTSSVVDIASHRVLEEELDLQLSLLKEHTPDLFLFPDEKEEIMKVLPNLHSDKQKDNEGVFHAPTPAEVIAFETTVLEENVLEPFLMCMVIVALAALPQLLN